MSGICIIAASVGFGGIACSSATPSAPATSTAAPAAAATDADKQWTMPNKNQSATRYSAVSEINTENVKNLKVAWSFSTGVLRGHEGEPLVVGNTMYVHTPFPNIVYALDLSKGRRAGQMEVRARSRIRRSFRSPAATP